MSHIGRLSNQSRRSRRANRGAPPAEPLPAADRLAIVKVDVEMNRHVWLSRFTRKHPDLVVEVHNVLVVGQHRVLGDFEILGPRFDWKDEIGGFPDVLEVGPLDVPPDLGRYRVLFRETVLVPLMVKLEVLLRYPTTARNGLLSFETVDRVSQIRQLLGALRRAGIKSRIASLRKEFLRSRRPNFTPAQREMFQQALAMGYFHVPRRITLTRLSQKLSRSKSTVSETLAIVERKLAETVAGTLA
jgi:hypothetical protein